MLKKVAKSKTQERTLNALANSVIPHESEGPPFRGPRVCESLCNVVRDCEVPRSLRDSE
jgi:hypothetical protein